MSSQTDPIGIFDSGIGGLTIAKSIVEAMPGEDIVYYGDTAHLPYGDKSPATITACSLRITDLLLQKNCKMIVIACNSASTAAFEAVRAHVGDRAIVMNVVDPLVASLAVHKEPHKMGLIGTRQTVRSMVYDQKIQALYPHITLVSHPTNLLASAIEEFGRNGVTDSLLSEYLSHPDLKDIQSLILACTHYPLLKDKINTFFDQKVCIIDPSDVVSASVHQTLQEHGLHNLGSMGTRHFHVSDYTDSFEKGARMFFGHTLHLEHLALE